MDSKTRDDDEDLARLSPESRSLIRWARAIRKEAQEYRPGVIQPFFLAAPAIRTKREHEAAVRRLADHPSTADALAAFFYEVAEQPESSPADYTPPRSSASV